VSGAHLALVLLAVPVLGSVSGCGAEALLRRAGPDAGSWRLALLIAASVLVVAVAAVGSAGVGGWWQVAVLLLAAVAVPLSAVDLAEHRIPNLVLVPAFALTALLLGLDAATRHQSADLVRALLAACALYAGALALLLSARDSLGYGDVKALAYQGLYTGYLGWARVLGALLLTFTAAALLALAAVRGGSHRLAFAPALLGATLAAVLIS
jgi:leader peptidase (prepilin peptidase)/N-methyltransferase